MQQMHILWENMFAYIFPDSKSIETYVAVPLSNNFNSTSVAEETLVHGDSGITDSTTSETTINPRSLDTTQNPDKSFKSRNFQFGGLDAIDRRFQKIGFSENTRKLLRAARRPGTQKDYDSKFRMFHSWCCAREIDPDNPALVHVADFLTHLYHKGLQYKTISGYRSMLSAVLPQVDNHKVGQHPYVILLLKGVFNSRPPSVRLLPEWDLLKVLDSLQKKPFEPLHKAQLKVVTLKTVFLMAITTFRRCGDLQSLKLGEGSVNIQKKGITFIRHGLAKQDRPSHFGTKIFIPAFPENKKLDPKRAFFYYLKATEKFRKSADGMDETKVFLGINEPHKPVSSQTISNWIVQTLKLTLQDKNLKVKAHSTRAIGSSFALFRGATIESVLASADWSRETTFTSFYLREMSCHVLKK